MAKAYQIDKLSVFFPTYNEEANIATTVKKAIVVLENVAKNWELTIVNDGSCDRTKEISEALAKKDKRIKVITHNPNRGYGGALQSGLYNARYDWITFTDSDGQFDFSEVVKFISSELLIKARRKGFKIVEIPITHYPRVAGSGTGRNIDVIIKSFVDLFKLWRKLR